MSTKKHDHHRAEHASHPEKRGALIEQPAPAVRTISDDERSRSIQVRAYGLWEQAGRPDGDEARVRFWCEAEQEIATVHAS